MKEKELEKDWMGTMKVSGAVAKMAIPSVISSLVTVLYNMADTFFVGQTGDALQVAAVSLTNPIFILFMAFANMFGMGGSAAASMALGQKNERRVRQVSSFVTSVRTLRPMSTQEATRSTWLWGRPLSSGPPPQALWSGRRAPAGRPWWAA